MNLERAILEVLDAAASSTPRPLTERVIHGGVGGFIPEIPTSADLQRALHRLEQKGQIAGTKNGDDDTVWIATAAGRLRLAE